MDAKITLLFFLVGTIIGLSHLDEDVLGRMRRRLDVGRWRELVPGRRKA